MSIRIQITKKKQYFFMNRLSFIMLAFSYFEQVQLTSGIQNAIQMDVDACVKYLLKKIEHALKRQAPGTGYTR